MISEVHRVLAPGGVYVAVSYGEPQYRLGYLGRPEYEWSVEVRVVSAVDAGSSVHYVYVCRKSDG